MSIVWVSQTNLSKHYSGEVENACKSLGYDFVGVDIIPFENNIPKVPADKPTIFYGATKWINTIYENNIWNPGVFFNPDSVFTLWSDKYGKHCLNYGAEITTLNKLGTELKNGRRLGFDDNMLFIRPVSDQKEFAGCTVSENGIEEWAQKVMTDVPDFGQAPIIVSEPYGISHEWRLFIVDNTISSGSHYREYHYLKTDSHVPKDVIQFAIKRIREYVPSPVFVMDIGMSGDELFVIEIGCFNSAGFYEADIEKIIYDVSKLYC